MGFAVAALLTVFLRGSVVDAGQGWIKLRTLGDMRVFKCAYNGRAARQPVRALTEWTGGGCRVVRMDAIGNQSLRPAAVEGYEPQGNAMLSGVITRVGERSIEIRTRAGQHRIVDITAVTKFTCNGLSSRLDDLPRNAPVFIRGAQAGDGAFEAYLVAWGDILDPAP
jgi:hypothetical protein